MITVEQLCSIMSHCPVTRAEKFIHGLNATFTRYDISTPRRQAAFLAQIAHESGELRYIKELASGAAYDTGPLAERLGNTPSADGDGQLYKGRGLIQVTGRDNYKRCGESLALDLISMPEILEAPRYACLSAGWYWDWRGLNKFADAGDFRTITRRINGGYNGMEDRVRYWERAKLVLGIAK